MDEMGKGSGIDDKADKKISHGSVGKDPSSICGN